MSLYFILKQKKNTFLYLIAIHLHKYTNESKISDFGQTDPDSCKSLRDVQCHAIWNDEKPNHSKIIWKYMYM